MQQPGSVPGAPPPGWPQPEAPQSDFGVANGIYCVLCGSTPAAPVNFRAHRGLILLMQFRTARGPFCRDCGLATFRRMTGDSLWQGWWGPLSSVINPITMLINLGGRATVSRLSPPIPGGPYRPLDPGRPLFQRPQILGLLVPVVAIGVIVAAVVAGSSSSGSTTIAAAPDSVVPATTAPSPAPESGTPSPSTESPTPSTPSTDPDSAKPGDCVWNRHQPNSNGDDSNPDVQIVPCGDPNAQARVLGRISGAGGLPACTPQYPSADAAYTQKHTGNSLGDVFDYTLCLQSMR
jgi:hypothetical protein